MHIVLLESPINVTSIDCNFKWWKSNATMSSMLCYELRQLLGIYQQYLTYVSKKKAAEMSVIFY